jgi:molybdopterin molybdotransferase
VIAQECIASADIPAEVRSARDGYALKAAETVGASDYNPLLLRLQSTAGSVKRGYAVSICCGDPLPSGADAVLPAELAEIQGRFLEVMSSLAPGEGVAHPGEECGAGNVLLPAGRRLRPQDLALLALDNLHEISVQSLPRVRLVLANHFGNNAIKPMLQALIERDGGVLSELRGTGNEDEIVYALLQADADLILVAGGTGYEEHDAALRALNSIGAIDVDGVAIHPGTGLVLGRVKSVPVTLLPGSPLACLCAYDIVVAPLLRRLSGKLTALPYRRRRMTLTRKISSSIGRLELARVTIAENKAEPIATAEGRILNTAVQADGFLLVPEQSEGYAQDSLVDVYLYDEYD